MLLRTPWRPRRCEETFFIYLFSFLQLCLVIFCRPCVKFSEIFPFFCAKTCLVCGSTARLMESSIRIKDNLTHRTCNFQQPPSLLRENYSFHHLKASRGSHPYLVLRPAMICGSGCQANKFGYGGRVLLAAVNRASGGESRGLYYTV